MSSLEDLLLSFISKCSTTCGGGEQKRDVMCMASNRKKYVDSSKCEMSQKPAITQRCNVKTCPGPEWKAGEWEAVSGESVMD